MVRQAAGISLAVLQSVPLYRRRRQPLIVLLVVVAAATTLLALRFQVAASELAVALAVYSVSVYGASRWRLIVAGLAGAAIVVGVVGVLLGQTERLPSVLPFAALSLVVWVVGDYFRNRHHYLAELEARAEKLMGEIEGTRRQTAEEERLRIARELHDVVAHNVSLMAIQAGGARLAGGAGEAGGRALESIELTARDTLAELNRLLGVLRKDGITATRTPQPGLGQLDTLLNPPRESGLTVALKVTGERRPLPAALDVSAYRIVQEAITNALKHSNASRLDVNVAYCQRALELRITDNGIGSPVETIGSSTGHGLIGMRERVELFGGELTVGSTPLGGFSVIARLPLG